MIQHTWKKSVQLMKNIKQASKQKLGGQKQQEEATFNMLKEKKRHMLPGT